MNLAKRVPAGAELVPGLVNGEPGVVVRHPYQLARGGMCIGTAVRTSVREIVRELKTGNQSLYY